ncbi:MAG TPA: LysR family transcriptional regulator [Streptosporangiaceae bacterium]|jgi:DNA-binding transcriptional LysR family regulator
MLFPEEVTTFLAIARQGNLQKAARAVHASQSTVSYRLQALEQRVGQPLVQRGRGVRQIALTPAGERFLGIAEQWEHLAREAERIPGRTQTALAVGAAHALNLYLLGPLYTWLGGRTPRPSLRIESAGGPALCDRVALRRLDAAFVFFDRAHAELAVDPVATSPMVVVRAPGAEAAPSQVDTADLPAGGEITMSWGPDFELWRSRNLTDEPLATVETAQSLVPFLVLGDTWSVVPEFAAAHLVAQTGCRVQRLASPPPDRTIHLVTNRRATSAAADALALLRTGLAAVAADLPVHPVR